MGCVRYNRVTCRKQLVRSVPVWEIKKSILVSMVIGIMLLATFGPMPMKVAQAALTDTIRITFDPSGNVSIDISPDDYNFSSFWSFSNDSTPTDHFTMWNNGTVDHMQTTIQVTDSPESLTIVEKQPTADDNYGLYLTGAVSNNGNWLKESSTIVLDSDLDRAGTETFGFILYMSNITTNHYWQSLNLTITGSLA